MAMAVCNICGASDWKDQNGRIGVRCGSCGSVERTRATKLVLDHLRIPAKGSRVLHFAPERGLYRFFSDNVVNGYDPVDLSPENFSGMSVRRFDIVADSPSLKDNYYDLIVHSHVIEHIPCNLAYIFYHLSRALKPNGLHVFSAPFLSGHYDEYLGPLPKEESVRRFGQDDHIRKLGTDDTHLQLGLIMKLQARYTLSDYADEETMDACNIPISDRSGLNSSTVIVASKFDYLLRDHHAPFEWAVSKAKRMLSSLSNRRR